MLRRQHLKDISGNTLGVTEEYEYFPLKYLAKGVVSRNTYHDPHRVYQNKSREEGAKEGMGSAHEEAKMSTHCPGTKWRTVRRNPRGSIPSSVTGNSRTTCRGRRPPPPPSQSTPPPIASSASLGAPKICIPPRREQQQPSDALLAPLQRLRPTRGAFSAPLHR